MNAFYHILMHEIVWNWRVRFHRRLRRKSKSGHTDHTERSRHRRSEGEKSNRLDGPIAMWSRADWEGTEFDEHESGVSYSLAKPRNVVVGRPARRSCRALIPTDPSSVVWIDLRVGISECVAERQNRTTGASREGEVDIRNRAECVYWQEVVVLRQLRVGRPRNG